MEHTENKSNIGSGALNDLVFMLYCSEIGQWLPTSRQSVRDQLGSDRRSVGDCILGVCFRLQKVCNFLEIGRQPIGDWSAISRRLNTVSGLFANAATGRRSVANQSAICRRPPKTFLGSIWLQRGFTCSNQNLLATKSSLQPVADQSRTSLQPPCNLPATTRNFGRKEVADWLQAMCDRGLNGPVVFQDIITRFWYLEMLIRIVLRLYTECQVWNCPGGFFGIPTKPSDTVLIIPSARWSWRWYTGFTLSVFRSVGPSIRLSISGQHHVRSVFCLQYSLDPFHIYTS